MLANAPLLTGWKWMRDSRSGLVIDLAALGAQYFAIPKVACSSLMSASADLLGIVFPAGEWKPELFQTNKWDHLYHRSEVVLTKRAALRLGPARWRFAFVRNPWDRLVSCYTEKIREDGDPENFVNGISKVLAPFGIFRRGMSFEDFARAATDVPDERADPHWRSQYTFIVDARGRHAMDFVGRFETISVDFACVSAQLGATAELPHLLASARRPYSDYYTAALRDRVAERYARDIRLFGYSFAPADPQPV